MKKLAWSTWDWFNGKGVTLRIAVDLDALHFDGKTKTAILRKMKTLHKQLGQVIKDYEESTNE